MTEDLKATIRSMVRKHIDAAVQEMNNEDIPYEWFGVNAGYHITEAACIPIFTQIEACEMMRESEIRP